MIGIDISIHSPYEASGGGASTGFDESSAGTDIVLSGDNYICETETASSTDNANARSIATKSDNALYYFEVYADFGAIRQAYIGVCKPAHSNADRVGYSKDSIGLYQNGTVYNNGSLELVNGFLNYLDPCTVRVWFNPSTGNVWFGKDSNVVGNPAAQTSPASNMTGGDFAAAVTPYRPGSTFTLNATAATISYSALGATPLED